MKYTPELDFYTFLGLQNFASLDTVKAKYRLLAMLHHPDRGGDIDKMKRLNHIYDVFIANKLQYDNWLRQQLAPKIAPSFVSAASGSDWTTAYSDMVYASEFARAQSEAVARFWETLNQTANGTGSSFTFGGI